MSENCGQQETAGKHAKYELVLQAVVLEFDRVGKFRSLNVAKFSLFLFLQLSS
jgi:hypothetical protein